MPLKIFYACWMRNKKEKISGSLLHSDCGVSLPTRPEITRKWPKIII